MIRRAAALFRSRFASPPSRRDSPSLIGFLASGVPPPAPIAAQEEGSDHGRAAPAPPTSNWRRASLPTRSATWCTRCASRRAGSRTRTASGTSGRPPTAGTSTSWTRPRARSTEIFDNDRIAAELTRITRDPWDAQHLPIRTIRFTGPNTIQFDVESSQEEEVEEDEEDEEDVEEEDQEDEQQRGPRQPPDAQHRPPLRVRRHHAHVARTRRLRGARKPSRSWASVSPDTAWVVFSREFNLWMMSYEEYMKIVEARRGKSGDEAEEAEEDVEVEEIQLTTDGEKDFSWGFTGPRTERRGDRRGVQEAPVRSGTTWSHDSRYFALTQSGPPRSRTSSGSSTPWATRGPSWRATGTTCRARRTSRRPASTSSTWSRAR